MAFISSVFPALLFAAVFFTCFALAVLPGFVNEQKINYVVASPASLLGLITVSVLGTLHVDPLTSDVSDLSISELCSSALAFLALVVLCVP